MCVDGMDGWTHGSRHSWRFWKIIYVIFGFFFGVFDRLVGDCFSLLVVDREEGKREWERVAYT